MPRFNSSFGCRTCTGADITVSPDLTAPKDIFPVDPGLVGAPAGTDGEKAPDLSEADPSKLIGDRPAASESFLTSPVGATVAIGGLALGAVFLLSNMGTTRGKPSFR